MLHIERFYDDGLAHASRAVLSEKQIALVNPAKDPELYLNFAERHGAKIVAVVETHLHAGFVSSHLEMHQKTGASIYASNLAEAIYPHTAFDQGDQISVGKITLQALNTPGHSPGSTSILVTDEQG